MPTDKSQATEPQFQMGATSDEAALYAQLSHSPLEGQGAISRQFELPRAEPDADMSDRPGINTGES